MCWGCKIGLTPNATKDNPTHVGASRYVPKVMILSRNSFAKDDTSAPSSLHANVVFGRRSPTTCSAEFDPEVLQSGFGVKFLVWPGEFLGKLPANVSANFSSEFFPQISALFLQGFRPPKKVTPKIVDIPLGSQRLVPKCSSRRCSAYGGDHQNRKGVMSWGSCQELLPNAVRGCIWCLSKGQHNDVIEGGPLATCPRDAGTSLVAQCSAIGVSVAATQRVAWSVFARKFPRDTVTGVARWVRQALFFGGGGGGCSATPPRHL